MGFDYRDKKSILIIILIFIFLKYINQGFQDEQAEISSNQPEILQVREEDGELIYNGPTGEYQNVWHPENKLHVCLQDLEIRSTYVDNLQHKKNKHSLSAFKSGAIVPNDKVIEVEEDDPSIQDPEPIIVYEEVEVYEPLPNVQSFTASAASASTRSQNEIQLEGELDYIKSSNPCSSEPADSIQGLTPPTDCQIKNSQGKYSIFKETRPKGVPNVVNLVDGNGQIGPNIFPHYEITKDPKIELKSCALMDPAPCRLFDEVKPSWNLIEDDTYSKIVNLQDNSYHTSAIQTLATMEKLQCNMRGQLIIKIQARDHMGRDKKYGGDLIIARMVDKTKFPDYDEYKNLKAGILGHEFFLSDKKGVKRSKFYGETIYAGHTVDNQDGTYKILIPCSAAGSFRLQVFLLQTAEAMTATNHMFRTLNAKGTIKNQDSKSCSSFISDQLPGGNPANVCQVKNDLLNGFSWFCPGPSGTCSMESASYESNNMVSDLAEDLGLLETSEELILKRDVLIFKNRDPKPAPSHNKVAGNVLLGAWTDRILLAYANRATSMESIVEALSTKTIVALGDSVLKQMWEVFFNDVYEYIEGKVGKGAKRRRKRRETTLNIDDLYINGCKSDQPPSNHQPALETIQVEGSTLSFNLFSATQALPFQECSASSAFTPEIFKRMIQNNWIGKNYIITLGHGLEMANWHPIIYYNRLVAIKKAAVEYKNVSPETIIIFKTSHYTRGGLNQSSSGVSGAIPIWQRDLIFKVFGNPYLDDIFSDEFPVKVLDILPMSLNMFDHFESGEILPPESFARMSVHMLLNMLWKMRMFG